MESITIDTRFFRAGVGTVIYNQTGQVALFERAKHPIGVWEFQQGGIDLGEDIVITLWRELQEELGLSQDNIKTVEEMPNWTVYQTIDSVSKHEKSRLGQAHKWFFLELKSGHQIDLTKADDNEASSFKWTTFTDAITLTEEVRKPVYQELADYFIKNISP